MASDDRQVVTLKNRLSEAQEEAKNFRQKILARVNTAKESLPTAAWDVSGALLALGEKAGIEAIVDKARKVQTPVGQFRTPNIYSGAIATGVGLLEYGVSILPGIGVPMEFYQAIPKAGGFGLLVLGLKELGQAAVVWNERRQLTAINNAAAQIAAAQQPQLSNEAAKK